MPRLAFQQVDVFSSVSFKGNPVAVVIGADALSDVEMATFANWTNLSETTFLLQPTVPEADYRVRIFTPNAELPFAGHPTLGSCHAWLASGGQPRTATIIQQCGLGLVPIRQHEGRLAFAAPPLRRLGEVDAALLGRIANGLRIDRSSIRAAQWADSGSGWAVVRLGSRAEVLALRPDFSGLSDVSIGVIGPWDPLLDGTDADFEVRAFIGVTEDPVTGSLNAVLAQWQIGGDLAPSSYVASQGTALGRAGRVHVDQVEANIWIGGATVTYIDGHVSL